MKDTLNPRLEDGLAETGEWRWGVLTDVQQRQIVRNREQVASGMATMITAMTEIETVDIVVIQQGRG